MTQTQNQQPLYNYVRTVLNLSRILWCRSKPFCVLPIVCKKEVAR
jgi:hypothetical protein